MKIYLTPDFEDFLYVRGKKKSSNSKPHINTNIDIFLADCKRAEPSQGAGTCHPMGAYTTSTGWPQCANLEEKSYTLLIGCSESQQCNPSFGDLNVCSELNAPRTW